jgi:hypothetical protein
LGDLLDIGIEEYLCEDGLKGGSEFIVSMKWQDVQKTIWVNDFSNGSYVAQEWIRDPGDRTIEIRRIFLHFQHEFDNLKCPNASLPITENTHFELGKFKINVQGDLKVDQERLPACIGDEKMYHGKWVKGRWLPYECRLNHKDVVARLVNYAHSKKPFWIHFYGDSVTRYSFGQIITLIRNYSNEKVKMLSCITQRAKIIHFENSNLVMTLDVGWYNLTDLDIHKNLKLQLSKILDDRCNNSIVVPEEARRLFHFEDDVYFRHPNLTFYSFGSHSPGIVHPEDEFQSLFKSLESNGYNGVLFNLITDLDEWMIPQKFGPQYLCRNALRIHALNKALTRALNKFGNPNGAFLGYNDLFSITYSGRTSIHSDAIHFSAYPSIELATVDLLRAFYLYDKIPLSRESAKSGE